MSEPEELRKEPFLVETWHTDNPPSELPGRTDERALNGREPLARPAGSPLPMGSTGRPLQDQSIRPVSPQGRALPGPLSAEEPGMQRAMGMLKQAMPFVQKLLPLIDGNITAAVANLFSPRSQVVPAPPPVDLAPVHSQLSELQVQHQDLRTQLFEQNTSLKRVEDQLEMVREATDRNTLEQQELIEDLKAVGNKVNLFALLLFAMLVVSVILNLVLFLHIKQVLP